MCNTPVPLVTELVRAIMQMLPSVLLSWSALLLTDILVLGGFILMHTF